MKQHTQSLAAIVIDGINQQVEDTLQVIKRHSPKGNALCNDMQAVNYLTQILEHLKTYGLGHTIESVTHASHSIGIAMEYTKTLLRVAGNDVNRSFSNPLSMQPEGNTVLQWLKGIWLRLRGIARQLIQLLQDYFRIDQWRIRGRLGTNMLGLSDVCMDITFNTEQYESAPKTALAADEEVDDDNNEPTITAEEQERAAEDA